MMKGVIVGAGFMGRTHLEAYASRKDAEIVCIVDRDEQKAKALTQAYGIEALAELSRALEEWKIDFVDVCLPSTLHKQAVVTALEAGAHVLVEKPFALSLEDADAMIEAADKARRRLMVAHVCRFMPQYQYLKQTVATERLGKSLIFSAWRLSETPGWSWNNWLNDKSLSGGTLLDLSIHDLDIANWLFGTPVEHRLKEIASPLKTGPSHLISSLGYPGIGAVTIEASHLMPAGYPFSAGFRLVTERGSLEWGTSAAQPGCLGEFTDQGEQQIEIKEEDPYRREIQHFLDCLRTGKAFAISPREARLAVRTVAMLQDPGGCC